MRRQLVLVGSLAAIVVGASAFSLPSTRQPATAQVMVHCPAGTNAAFVSPPQVRINVGDNVEWRMDGTVQSDSIIIQLKNADQAWPFAGAAPRSAQSARANNARNRGTYAYNVTLYCRGANESLQRVVIDPDIIID